MTMIEESISGLTGSVRSRPAVVRPPGARRGKRGGGRRAKGQDLASMIRKFLATAARPVGIPAIVEGVKRLGYKSSSPSFARIVGMRLGDRKNFKRTGRGQYLLRKK